MKKERATPNYMKIVEWSDEDGCFVGSAPPLIGRCCHGSDEAKVFKELSQIVSEWIAIFKSDGVPLPAGMGNKKYSGKILVRLDPDVHRALVAKAKAVKESLNEFVTDRLVNG